MPVKKPGFLPEIQFDEPHDLPARRVILPPRFRPPSFGAPKYSSGSPIMLSASATLRPNAPTQVNQLALANPTGKIIQIDEIRWHARISPSNTDYVRDMITPAGLIGCKLALGNKEICGNSTPICLFDRRWSSYEEYLPYMKTSAYNGSQCRWRLRHPIYIRPGESLMPLFEHRGITALSFDITITMSGQIVDRVAEEWLPFVTSWTSKPFAYGVADSDASSEFDLSNPFDGELDIEEITGRSLFVQTRSSAMSSIGGEWFGGFANVKLECSTGHLVLPEATPFELVFDPSEAVMLGRHSLPGKSFYNAAITTNYDANAASFVGWTFQYQIGLIGYRRVA